MPISSTILFGFLRFSLLIISIFLINKKWINKTSTTTFLDFIVFQWFKYGSALGMLLFITVQLEIYDLLNCLILLSVLLSIEAIGIKNLSNPIVYFEFKIKKLLHKVIHRIGVQKEKPPRVIPSKKQSINLEKVLSLFSVATCVIASFSILYYFIRFDIFTLSNGWFSDLQKMIYLESQQWFTADLNISGSLAYASFYGKITNLSPETALQSIGILELVLLTIIVFWTIKEITLSTYFAPFISALSFAFLYVLVPININFILENKPTYLALTFALPAMVFSLKTTLLKINRYLLFIFFLLTFLVISLIDLFTFFILLPPFLLLSILFSLNQFSKRFWLVIVAFLFATAICLTFYSVVCSSFNTDFNLFLHSNLISTNSYIYAPQLMMSLPKLVNLYLISGIIGLVIASKYLFINKENWKASFLFLLYFVLLLLSKSITNSWIDSDLISQTFPVFIPILIGINTALFIRVFKGFILKLKKSKPYAIAILLVGWTGFVYYLQKPILDKFEKSDPISLEIVMAYDLIWTTFFPYTYAVVNTNKTQLISKNKHYFMSYSFFMEDYPIQDSIYFNHYNDNRFFKANPNRVIPKSILLFVYKKQSISETEYSNQKIMNQIYALERKGRGVQLFFSCPDFDVYEVINEPKSSKYIDLIF